jgi:hypothetical protein
MKIRNIKKNLILVIGVILLITGVYFTPLQFAYAKENINSGVKSAWKQKCHTNKNNTMCVQAFDIDASQYYQDKYSKNDGGGTDVLFALEAVGNAIFYGKTVYVQKVNTYIDDFWTGWYFDRAIVGKIVRPTSKEPLDISGELWLI